MRILGISMICVALGGGLWMLIRKMRTKRQRSPTLESVQRINNPRFTHTPLPRYRPTDFTPTPTVAYDPSGFLMGLAAGQAMSHSTYSGEGEHPFEPGGGSFGGAGASGGWDSSPSPSSNDSCGNDD